MHSANSKKPPLYKRFLVFVGFLLICIVVEDGKHNTSDSEKRLEASLDLIGQTYEGEAWPDGTITTKAGERYFYQHSQIIANAVILYPFGFIKDKFFPSGKDTSWDGPQVFHPFWNDVYVTVVNPIYGATALYFAFLIGLRYAGFSTSLAAVFLYLAAGTFLAYSKFNTSNSFTTLILFGSHYFLRQQAKMYPIMLAGSLVGFIGTSQKISMIGNAASYVLACLYQNPLQLKTNKVLSWLAMLFCVTVLGSLGFVAMHLLRFEQLFPYLGSEFAATQGDVGPNGLPHVVSNFLSFWFNPGRAFIFYEPLAAIGLVSFFYAKQFRAHIIFAFGCLLSTMLVHSFVDLAWGNMVGNRYINSQAGVLSFFGGLFVLTKICKRIHQTLIIIAMLFLFAFPFSFFHYHAFNHARVDSDKCHLTTVPCSYQMQSDFFRKLMGLETKYATKHRNFYWRHNT